MEANSDFIISEDILSRKGARKAAEIPEHIRHLPQSGTIESVNLTEWLAVDHLVLLEQITHELDIPISSQGIASRLEPKDQQRIMKVIPAIGIQWLEYMKSIPVQEKADLFTFLAKHRSDSIRLLGGLYHRTKSRTTGDRKAGTDPSVCAGCSLWRERDRVDGGTGLHSCRFICGAPVVNTLEYRSRSDDSALCHRIDSTSRGVGKTHPATKGRSGNRSPPAVCRKIRCSPLCAGFRE